jgi:hypothetical protein
MIIIGAGLAGLLAANLLRHKNPTILEKQPTLPNNHSAVLRFRSSIVSDVTGIPFKKVNVVKAALPWLNPVADSLAYAEKNTGLLRSDRSISVPTPSVERYIGPINLIEQLSLGLNIKFNNDGLTGWKKGGPIISTIPMPAMMEMLCYPKLPVFPSVPGCNIRATISGCDAYASLYVPNPFYPFSRISLTGNEIIAECPNVRVEDEYPEIMYTAASLLGISKEMVFDIEWHQQTYSKILPIDEGERKRFMAWATDEHNVYSLGRYACWRPGLLLDDLVQDIRLIERWINAGGDKYAMRKQRASGLDDWDPECIPGN